MSVKLSRNEAKNINQNFASLNGGDDWYWGKASKTKDGFEIVGCVATCKDYLVDMQFRRTHLGVKDQWTEQEWSSNCYYIVFPTKQIFETFEKNVKEVLNVYEKKHRFARTIVTKIDETPSKIDNIVAVIEGSKKWTSTTMALSFYLSLIRLCGYITMDVEDLTSTMDNTGFRLCNELGYFYTMGPECKKIYNHYYQHPREMMPKIPKTHTNTGWAKAQGDLSHGMTGLFYLMQYMVVYTTRAAGSDNTMANNMFYPKIKEMYKNMKEAKQSVPL